MLDTSNLSKFLKGITDALRTIKGTTDIIEHKFIDEEILNLSAVNDKDDNYNIIKAILMGCKSSMDYSNFFRDSDINDTQLATFVREFPNELGKRVGSSVSSVSNLFRGCRKLTVIPKNTFYIDSVGIKGTNLFGSTSNIVAIWVPLRFYCENSGADLAYYQRATDILPTSSMSNSTLKEIRVAENGIKQSIDFSYYYGFSKESYMSIADGLIDLTGTSNAYKLTINDSYRVMGNDYDKFILKVHNKGWTIVTK